MKVEPVNFGDANTRHGYYQPVYRVDFWRRYDPPAGGAPEKMGYQQESHRVSGAKNVSEVRSWAREHGGGREFVIWIELGPADDRTIARVEGVDPTNPQERELAE